MKNIYNDIICNNRSCFLNITCDQLDQSILKFKIRLFDDIGQTYDLIIENEALFIRGETIRSN
jgi:hypothetical protein